MGGNLRQSLSHLLWIGGATDSGKTTISKVIACRYGLGLYHYDRTDLTHHDRLAQNLPQYRAFLDASLDERWVQPEPEDLVERALETFRDRFPLVIEDLLALPKEPKIVAEGFGLTPELLFPVLLYKHQAIWLVPTDEFKRASMERRNKPSFKNETSDPQSAAMNLLARDILLVEHVKAQARLHGLTLYGVDGTRSIAEMVALVELHFGSFLYERETAA
jgi:2-phosphoglycerate kinase